MTKQIGAGEEKGLRIQDKRAGKQIISEDFETGCLLTLWGISFPLSRCIACTDNYNIEAAQEGKKPVDQL